LGVAGDNRTCMEAVSLPNGSCLLVHAMLQLRVSSMCPLCGNVSPLHGFELRLGPIGYRRRATFREDWGVLMGTL